MTSLGLFEAHVVAAGEADVLFEGDDLGPGKALPHRLDGAIVRTVVDDQGLGLDPTLGAGVDDLLDGSQRVEQHIARVSR